MYTVPVLEPVRRPRALRRVAITASGILACAIPVVFTVTISVMLLTGTESSHRFHQLTGQGLILTSLWLGGLVPLLRAGWAGRRPSSAAGLLHLSFVLAGILCAVVTPGGGAPMLMVVIAVPGALVWLSIPQRPRLRLPVRVHPLLTPLALGAVAALTPYVLDQIALQDAATGYHADNPHHFDMAWLVCVLLASTVLGALLPAVRRLVVVGGAGLAALGTAGVALGADFPWTPVALASGAALILASRVRR
ncbi:hypothetical protein DDE18_00485 [Nocardioides gansuensis]|uniref:Uncharacterized protein n=2 Tax=Nocardioides gansuensis TaxID=2138300 RepID=A0A2T8FEM8_9ACTN|nr:hypothetical protein DDE18_00485 [Nocardioides gansuensis]